MGSYSLMLILLGALSSAGVQNPSAPDPDQWGPLRYLEGRWEGAIDGSLGTGIGLRHYEFFNEGQYLMRRHGSVRMPQEKSPEGDHHREIGIYSYDATRKTIVLREFMIESVVVRSPCEIEGMKVVCVAEHVESGEGIEARLEIELESPFEYTESYELKFPDESQVRFRNRWRRLPSLP